MPQRPLRTLQSTPTPRLGSAEETTQAVSVKWGFEQELGLRRARCLCHECQHGGEDDPRLAPVVGDWIDELVNWQMERGQGK